MPQIYAVVGMGFGDEGKGHMVDYLTSKLGHECIVCRYNGGSQAGHTVVRNDNTRHVFSHFGSGAFNGCQTHLSKYFIVNPILFNKERDLLSNLSPQITVDPNCIVTTPYDMLLNRNIEKHRELINKDSAHGSCGVGIFETLKRSLDLPLFVNDLDDKALTKLKMLSIYKYAKEQIKKLGIQDFTVDMPIITDVIKLFEEDCEKFLSSATIVDDKLVLEDRDIVFEGAQGLQLDEKNNKYFPHLTPSSTGLKNVCSLLSESNQNTFTAVYATRSYITRHGNGPLPFEIPAKEFLERHPTSFDKTNIKNDWQGSLRYASFNLDYYNDAIKDLELARSKGFNINCEIAITCMDQMNNPELRNMKELKYLSYGPATKDVMEL
jgi:adenylosuccinate synthase